jgi:glutathionyl-hydroquinone reductase
MSREAVYTKIEPEFNVNPKVPTIWNENQCNISYNYRNRLIQKWNR